MDGLEKSENSPELEESAEAFIVQDDVEEPLNEFDEENELSNDGSITDLDLTAENSQQAIEDRTCDECQESFSTLVQLFKHSCNNRTALSNGRKYNKTIRICKHCGRQLKSISTFRRHVLDCWRKRVGLNSDRVGCADNEQLPEQDMVIKAEPIDSDDTIIPDTDDNLDIAKYDTSPMTEVNSSNTNFSNEEKIEIVVPETLETTKTSKGKVTLPETHCSRCFVRFKNLKHYTCHKKRKIPCIQPPYICQQCGVKFLSEYNLHFHVLKKRCGLKQRRIKYAKKAVTKPVIETHEDQMDFVDVLTFENENVHQTPDQDEQTTVLICPKEEPKDQELLKCELCDANFLFSHLRKRHYEQIHKSELENPMSVDSSFKINGAGIKKKPKVLPFKKKVLKLKTPHKEKLPSDIVIKQEEDKDESDIDVSVYFTPNGYQCPKCDHYFPFPYRLRYHLNRKVPCKPTGNNDEKKTKKGLPKLKIQLQKPKVSKARKNLHAQLNGGSGREASPTKKFFKMKEISNGKVKKRRVADPILAKYRKIPLKKPENLIKPKLNSSSKALCKICNIVFPSVPDCYDHCLLHHNGMKENLTTPNSGNKVGTSKIEPPRTSVTISINLLQPNQEGKVLETPSKVFNNPPQNLYSENVETFADCPVCLKKFGLLKSRNSHLRQAHKNIAPEKISKYLKTAYCKRCRKSFPSPLDKTEHYKIVHGIDIEEERIIFFQPPKNTCAYCNIDFPSKTHLNTHALRCKMKTFKTSPRNAVKIESNQTPEVQSRNSYFCEHCDIKFGSLTLYKAHTNRFCPQKDLLKNTKPIDFKQELFGLDDKVHLKCEMCEGTFTKRLEYDVHIKELCPNKPKTSTPNIGSPRLSPKFNNRVRVSDNKEPLRVKLKVKRKLASSLFRSRTCLTCNKSFPTNSHYAGHRRFCKLKETITNTDLIVPEIPKQIDPITLSTQTQSINEIWPISKSTPKPIAVNINNPTPIKKTKLQKFNPKRVVTCTIPNCQRVFSDVFALQRHVRFKHSSQKEKTFNCMFCPRYFARPTHLTKHFQQAHPECLKFQCDASGCGRRYATNSRCVAHIKKKHKLTADQIKVIDLDEELFGNVNNELSTSQDKIQTAILPVPVANIKTSPKPVRIPAEEDGNHYTILDDTPGRGMYSCDICNVCTFTKINALRRHWKTKPHKENLEKQKMKQNFHSPSKSRYENESDSGEPLKCSVCSQTYYKISAFVHHRMVHFNAQRLDLGEINILNPYECEICHKVFTHHQRVQSHLLWHMKANRANHPATKFKLVKLPETVERQHARIPLIIEKLSEPDEARVSAKKSISGGTPTKASDITEKTEYCCQLCLVKFNSKFLFGAHIRHSCPRRFSCQHCSIPFPNKKMMLSHMLACESRGDLTCRFCFLKFQTANDLGWHEKCCVKVNESVKVNGKNTEFETSLTNSHILKCMLCQDNIYDPGNNYFEHHDEFHHDKKIEITCLSCNVLLTDKITLDEHLNQVPNGYDFSDSVSINENGDNYPPKEIEKNGLSDRFCPENNIQSTDSYTSKPPTRTTNESSLFNGDNLSLENEETKRLRSNFSQLMYLLISDPDLLASFGWGSRAIDFVLNDILQHLGHNPVQCENNDTKTNNLRSNIKLFMNICIREDLMEVDKDESVDGLVFRVLKMCSM